jgi:hypothetical protein
LAISVTLGNASLPLFLVCLFFKLILGNILFPV